MSKPAESSVNFRLNVTPLFVAPVKGSKSPISQKKGNILKTVVFFNVEGADTHL